MPNENIGIVVVNLILWFIVFLFSLSFHEAAHAWTSERFGDPTGRYQGRISLNPLAHIDPIGTILFPLIGFFSNIPLIGWAKPVQTNPLHWRDKNKASIMVSAAGPISNFILAAVSFAIIKALLIAGVFTIGHSWLNLVAPAPGQAPVIKPLSVLMSYFLVTNLGLGVFNLIPIPPLDGSHILESLLPGEMAEAYAQIRPYGFLLLMALLWLGILNYIYTPVITFVIRMLFA